MPGQGGCDSIVEQKIFSTTCVYPLKIKGLDTLDCHDGQYHLQCSATPAPQFCQWFLPDGTIVDTPALTPTQTGHYVLFAQSPSGCPATVGFDIHAHPMPPIASAGPDLTLPCDPPVVTLQGGYLQGGNASFSWSGPGIYPGNDNTLTPEVTVEGQYILTLENQQVNCFSRDTVEVIVGDAAPIAEAGPDVLFPCNLTAHPLHIGGTTTSAGPGIKYLWASDPPGGVSTAQSTKKRPLVLAPGLFTLTVNDTKKHCKKIDHVSVLPPDDPTANAGPDVLLNCSNSTGIQLSASGSQIPSGANFNADWAGPGIDAANNTANSPTVFLQGTYTVTVTDNATGCTDVDQMVITKTPEVPTANAGPNGQQTTPNQAVTFLGSGSAGGAPVEFRWTGPGITAANRYLAQPTVTLPGNYILRVKNLTTGCFARDRAIVFAPTTIAGNDDRAASEIFPETLRARVLPNPVEHGSQPEIFLENALPGKLTVSVFSITGNQLTQIEVTVAADRRAFPQKLPVVDVAGYYIIKVWQSGGVSLAVPMIVR